MAIYPGNYPWSPIMLANPTLSKMFPKVKSPEQMIAQLYCGMNSLIEYVNQLSNYYVPQFKGKWSDSVAYEPNDLVIDNEGNTWVALKPVPEGTPLVEGEYWHLAYPYSEQFNKLQNTVNGFQADIEKINDSFDTINASIDTINNDLYTTSMIGCTTYAFQQTTIDRMIPIYKLAKMQNVILYAEYDKGEITPSVSIGAYIVNSLRENGIECDTFKIHATSIDNFSTYIDAINNYLTGLSGIENVIILNESGTYIADNETAILGAIQNLQSNGYKVSISANMQTAKAIYETPSIASALDFFSFNLYPSAGYSYISDYKQLAENASTLFENLTNALVYNYPAKKIWITETGIINKACFLYSPEQYDTKNGFPYDSTIGREENDNILVFYDLCMINTLKNRVNRLYLWYSQEFTEYSATQIGLRGI